MFYYYVMALFIFIAVPDGQGSIAFIRFSTENLTTVNQILNQTITKDIGLLYLDQVVSMW